MYCTLYIVAKSLLLNAIFEGFHETYYRIVNHQTNRLAVKNPQIACILFTGICSISNKMKDKMFIFRIFMYCFKYLKVVSIAQGYQS